MVPWGDIFKSVSAKSNGTISAAPSMISEAFAPANRAERKALKRDIDALQKGELGYSQAQLQQSQAESLSQIANQSGAMTEALRRDNMQSGGSNSGDYFKAMRDIAKSGQDSAAQSRFAAVQQSDALAANRESAIRARISQKADTNKQFWSAKGKQLSGDESAAAGNTFGGGSAMGGMGGGKAGGSGSSSMIPTGR